MLLCSSNESHSTFLLYKILHRNGIKRRGEGKGKIKANLEEKRVEIVQKIGRTLILRNRRNPKGRTVRTDKRTKKGDVNSI